MHSSKAIHLKSVCTLSSCVDVIAPRVHAHTPCVCSAVCQQSWVAAGQAITVFRVAYGVFDT
jgi:hypothetical protein